MVHVHLRLPRGLTRNAQALKSLGQPALDEFDEALCVDNTVALEAAPTISCRPG